MRILRPSSGRVVIAQAPFSACLISVPALNGSLKSVILIFPMAVFGPGFS